MTLYTARIIYEGIFMSSVGSATSPSLHSSSTSEYLDPNQENPISESNKNFRRWIYVYYAGAETSEQKEQELKFLKTWTEEEDCALLEILSKKNVDFQSLATVVETLYSMGFERYIMACAYRYDHLKQLDNQKIVHGENPTICPTHIHKWEKKDEEKLLRCVNKYQGRENCWAIVEQKLRYWDVASCQAKYEELKSRVVQSQGNTEKIEKIWTRRQLSLLKEYGDLYFNRAKCWELVAAKIKNKFTPAECAAMYPSVATFT